MNEQQRRYSVRVQSRTVTLFVDPPAVGGPSAENRQQLANELAQRLLRTIQAFGVEHGECLIAVTP